MAADTKLFIELKNSKKFTPLNLIQNYKTFDQKNEQEWKIKDTDNFINLSIAQLDTLKKIIVISDNCILHIIVDGPINIDLPISGLFIFDLEATFAGTITGISISTPNTEDTVVDIRVFGESI